MIYDLFGIGYVGRFFDFMFVRGGTNDIKHHAKCSTSTTVDVVFQAIEARLVAYTQSLAKRVIFLGGGVPGKGANMESFGHVDHELGGVFSPPRVAVAVDAEIDRGLARLRQKVIEKQASNVWQTEVGVCYFQLHFPGQNGTNFCLKSLFNFVFVEFFVRMCFNSLV